MSETVSPVASYVAEARRHLRASARCDLTHAHALDGERQALAAAARPVTNPRAQDYVAWRRSMSFVALGFALVALVFALIDTISSLSDFGEQEYATGFASLLVLVTFASKAALGVGLLQSVRHWTDVRRSSRALALGWGIAIAVPLVVILLPLTDVMFDWDAVRFSEGQAVAEGQRVILETLIAVAMFWSAVPSLLALFPGLLRAALTVKTLLPARGVGPAVAAAISPIYTVFFVVVFGQLQQLSGSVLMGLGILLVAGAPLVFLRRAPQLVPPLAPEEAEVQVRAARTLSRWFSLAGLLLILITVFQVRIFGIHFVGFSGEDAMVNVWSFADTLIWFVAMLSTYTVVASDGLLRVMQWSDDNVSRWSKHAGRRPDAEVLDAVTEPFQAPQPTSAGSSAGA